MSIIIVDENRLRSDSLDDRLYYAKADDLFVLTEAALIEMLKTEQFESTAYQNLKFIREHADQVAISNAVSELMRIELHEKYPTVGVIDQRLTAEFRLYLEELRTQGDIGPRHAKIMDLVKLHRPSLALNQLNVAKKRLFLAEAVKKWRAKLSVNDLKALRNHEWTDAKWLKESGVTSVQNVIGILTQEGWNRQEALEFCKMSPAIFRLELAFNNLALYWLEWHGMWQA